MAKISKNAKKLLALTLAGVMTVGTVVPASAAAEASVDTVSTKAATELSEGFQEVYDAIMGEWAHIISSIPAFTTGHDSGNTVVSAINQAITEANTGNAIWNADQYTVTFVSDVDPSTWWLDGCESKDGDATRKLVEGELVIKNASGKTEKIKVTNETCLRFAKAETIAALVLANFEENKNFDISWDEYSKDSGLEGLQEDLNSYVRGLWDSVMSQENYSVFRDMFSYEVQILDASGAVTNTKPTSNPAKFTARVNITNTVTSTDKDENNDFDITLSVSDTNAEKQLDAVTEDLTVVLENFVSGAPVENTQEDIDDIVTPLQEQLNEALYNKGYYSAAATVNMNTNKNWGYIDTNNIWHGSVTLTINADTTDIVTKDVEIQLALSESDVVKKIELTDKRSSEEKEMPRYDQNHSVRDVINGLGGKVTFKVTMGDGTSFTVKPEVYNDNRIIFVDTTTGNEVPGLVLDYNEYEKGNVGSIKFYVRSTADASVGTAFEGKVYYDNTDALKAKKLGLPSNEDIAWDKMESEDEDIIKAVKVGDTYQLRAYNAGTTNLTISDNSGNTITVAVTVPDNGEAEFTTSFNAQSVIKTFDELKLLGVTADSEIVSADEDYLTVEYVTDINGNDCIKFTPKAIAQEKDQLYVYAKGGNNGKLVNRIPVTISETGAMNIKPQENLTNARFSISDKTAEAILATDYYRDLLLESAGENGIIDQLDTPYVIPTDNYSGIENIPESNLDVTVKDSTKGDVKDTLPLSAAEFEIANGDYQGKPNAGEAAWKISLEGFRGVAGSDKVTISGGAATIAGVTMYPRILVNASDSSVLGLIPSDVSVSKEGVLDIEKITEEVVVGKDEYPEMDYYAITVTTDKTDNATVTFKDNNTQHATLKFNTTRGRIIDKLTFNPFSLGDISEMEFTAPTKLEYTIGEDFDVSGGSFRFRHDGTENWINVDLEPGMFTGMDMDTVGEYNVKFNYGGVKLPEEDTFTVTVNPASITLSKEDLGLAEDEVIKNASITDGRTDVLDAHIYSGADFKVKVSSTKTDVKGVLTITTDKETVKEYNVSVDENGNITVDQVIIFISEDKTFTPEELGLNPSTVTDAVSSDKKVATAEILNDKIVVTSVNPGTAVITVTDKDDHKATIDITVAADGSITSVIHPYTVEGWVGEPGGDWSYIKADGTKVKSDWLEIKEGPNAGWYHFDKDGLMQRGWIVDETGWKIYYLDTNGRMYRDMWVNADAQENLGMAAGMYHLTADGPVQMNGWAKSVDNPNIEWFCNAGTGLFEVNNPASWRVVG